MERLLLTERFEPSSRDCGQSRGTDWLAGGDVIAVGPAAAQVRAVIGVATGQGWK